MDAGEAFGRLATHHVGDQRAHVTALGDKARVAEALVGTAHAWAMRPESQPSSVGWLENP